MPRLPKIFVDADVLIAGATSPSTHSASQVILLMSEITLLDCVTSEQVMTEAERNLADKLPHKLPEFRLLAQRSLRVVSDPSPASLQPYKGWANAKDLPILVAALQEGCTFLITFNVRHFSPPSGQITVTRPGEFLTEVRQRLSELLPE